MSRHPSDPLQPASSAKVPDFLAGGGEMGALIRAHDWSGSSLGPPDLWPQSLRTTVRLMLNTGHPMYIWWGPDHACLYNDAYRASIGPERHPVSLGRPAQEVWAEIWDIIHPQIEQVMSGRGATWHVNHLVPITRHGRREDVYWTYSYSPIDDEGAANGIGGVLVVCTETTQQIQAARQLAAERDRLAQLFELAPTFMALLSGPEHRFEIANPGYLRLIGYREVLGKTLAQALPDAVEQGYLALLDRVFETGEAYVANSARYIVHTTPDAPADERFVDFVYQPVKDSEEQVTGIFVVGVDVTHRTKAEMALRESETRFRAALNAGRMGSWETDHTTKTRHWSKEGMSLFGLDLPDGRGQVGGPTDEHVAAIHPDDRHMAHRFRELADRQDSFPAEYRVVKPDGSTRWLLGRGLVVERGPRGEALRLVSIMADVTERKLAEDQLRIERERLGLALRAGQMGAYDLNIKDNVLWWSPETYSLMGVDPATFVPSPESVIALIHPEDREGFWRQRAEAISQHRPFVYEFRVRRPDGTQAWIAYRGQGEYDAEGAPRRSFGIVMDITERKQSDELLRDADQKKDHFIAMLAHELRNPLAPIRNAIHVLRLTDPADLTKAAWCRDIIDRQVAQMARLLDDLLDVSRLSRGHLRLRLESASLSTAIRQAIEIAQPLLDAGGHSFTLTMPEVPLELHGDVIRLAQVFSNILINAAKYTPPHGRIAMSVQRRGDEAVVRVRDSGIGIAEEDMAHIFKMFGQVDSAPLPSQGGQGIGLALAKALVELHRGRIVARSEGPDRGSEFEVWLPLTPVALLASEQAAAPEAVRAEPTYRILIADDLEDLSDSLAVLLRMMGHVVDVAYDGEEALRLAEIRQPDAVLLDLGMPKLDGYEVCRRIRAAPWGRRMLLVAQTGWGQESDRLRTRDAGFDQHLVKPIDPDRLAVLLRSTIASGPAAMPPALSKRSASPPPPAAP